MLRELLDETPNDAKRKILESDLQGLLTCKRIIDEANKNN